MKWTIFLLVVLTAGGVPVPCGAQQAPTASELSTSPIIARIWLKSDTLRLLGLNEPDTKSGETSLERVRESRYYVLPSDSVLFVIDSVRVALEGGFIKDMVVYGNLTGGHTATQIARFRNARLIPLTTPAIIEGVNTRGTHVLLSRAWPDYGLDLSDVIDYERRVITASASYEPKDGVIVLGTDNHGEAVEMITLRKKSVLDNLNVALFTDLAGLSADRPNGLIQIESHYRVLWNPGTLGIPIFRAWSFIPFREAKAYVNLSKIEDQATEIPVDTTNVLHASSLDLYRYATVSAGLSAMVLSVSTWDWLGGVDAGLGVMQTIKTDSTGTENRIRTRYLNLSFIVSRIEGRRIDYDFIVRWQYLISNNAGIAYVDGDRLTHLRLKFNFHPNVNDKTKTLFFRYTYSFADEQSDDFSLEVGYSAPLSRVFGIKY